jgi:membrane-bound metal-dependent hydrolase YbcI (DUF457 family)
MFVGHFGVGLAGKKAAPRVSLGTWFLAAQFLDLLWPIFLLLGWEHVRIVPGLMKMSALDLYDYPFSHSLVAALVWSALFASVYQAAGREETDIAGRRRTALLLGGGVFSHWILDVLVHRQDVPIRPDGPYIGLGLWNMPAVEIPLEGGLYLVGIVLYLRATRARDAIGSWGLYVLLALLLFFWLFGAFGPPPPTDPTPMAWGALSMWLMVLWAYWVDRHRTVATQEASLPPPEARS